MRIKKVSQKIKDEWGYSWLMLLAILIIFVVISVNSNPDFNSHTLMFVGIFWGLFATFLMLEGNIYFKIIYAILYLLVLLEYHFCYENNRYVPFLASIDYNFKFFLIFIIPYLFILIMKMIFKHTLVTYKVFLGIIYFFTHKKGDITYSSDSLEVDDIYFERFHYDENVELYVLDDPNMPLERVEYKDVVGWEGSAKINGIVHTGKFSIEEMYTNSEGTECHINWADFIPELKKKINVKKNI